MNYRSLKSVGWKWGYFVLRILYLSLLFANINAADDSKTSEDSAEKRLAARPTPSSGYTDEFLATSDALPRKSTDIKPSADTTELSSVLPQPRKKQAASTVIESHIAAPLIDPGNLNQESSVPLLLEAGPIPLDLVELDKIFLRSLTPPSPAQQACMISCLSPLQKSILRLVSKRHRDYIDLSFFGPVYDPNLQVTAFSSETSGETIGTHILHLLGSAQGRVIIASDKCTNEELLDDLLALHQRADHPLEIRIVTGQDESTRQLMMQPKYAGIIWQSIASNHDNSGKMHNKFIIIDDHIVITGSPNLTYAAYNYNVESFVAIHHRFIARLYYRYYEYIISGKNKYDHTQDEYCRVAKMMQVFNTAPNNPIQVCLAPVYNIKTFIIGELDLTQSIDINMFLVSRATEPDNDIVPNLLKAVNAGANVSLKVDGGQYDTMRYMRVALADLTRRAQAFTVSKKPQQWRTRTKSITTRPQFHDKLVLIQQTNGVKKVFIGSAGFTDNVQDNKNLENMVLLKIPNIYDALLGHFHAIDASRGDLEIKQL